MTSTHYFTTAEDRYSIPPLADTASTQHTFSWECLNKIHSHNNDRTNTTLTLRNDSRFTLCTAPTSCARRPLPRDNLHSCAWYRYRYITKGSTLLGVCRHHKAPVFSVYGFTFYKKAAGPLLAHCSHHERVGHGAGYFRRMSTWPIALRWPHRSTITA